MAAVVLISMVRGICPTSGSRQEGQRQQGEQLSSLGRRRRDMLQRQLKGSRTRRTAASRRQTG